MDCPKGNTVIPDNNCLHNYLERNCSCYLCVFVLYCIVLYILGPIACWCPMSPHFLTKLVSRSLGMAFVSWASARVGVHRLFACRLSLAISRCFSIHSSSSAIEFHSCFFISLQRRICSHSVDPSFTHIFR